MNKNCTYIYDPKRQILVAYENGKSLGGLFGRIADKTFESLLMTEAEIKLGEILSKQEKLERSLKTM